MGRELTGHGIRHSSLQEPDGKSAGSALPGPVLSPHFHDRFERWAGNGPATRPDGEQPKTGAGARSPAGGNVIFRDEEVGGPREAPRRARDELGGRGGRGLGAMLYRWAERTSRNRSSGLFREVPPPPHPNWPHRPGARPQAP